MHGYVYDCDSIRMCDITILMIEFVTCKVSYDRTIMWGEFCSYN